jgi:hypothetical protein
MDQCLYGHGWDEKDKNWVCQGLINQVHWKENWENIWLNHFNIINHPYKIYNKSTYKYKNN